MASVCHLCPVMGYCAMGATCPSSPCLTPPEIILPNSLLAHTSSTKLWLTSVPHGVCVCVAVCLCTSDPSFLPPPPHPPLRLTGSVLGFRIPYAGCYSAQTHTHTYENTDGRLFFWPFMTCYWTPNSLGCHLSQSRETKHTHTLQQQLFVLVYI